MRFFDKLVLGHCCFVISILFLNFKVGIWEFNDLSGEGSGYFLKLIIFGNFPYII